MVLLHSIAVTSREAREVLAESAIEPTIRRYITSFSYILADI